MTTPCPMSDDPRPLQALVSDDVVCFDCLSSLSPVVAALDAEGCVVYGNAAFADLVEGWDKGVSLPQPLVDLLPQVAAALPDLALLNSEIERTHHVQEIRLGHDENDLRDHLVYLDPIVNRGSDLIRGWALTLIDISHVRHTERSNYNSLQIERSLSRISSRFVGHIDLNAAIQDSLEDVGRLASAEYVFYCLWDQEPNSGLANMLLWQTGVIPDATDVLNSTGKVLRQWYTTAFPEPEIVELDDIPSQLPKVLRDSFNALGDDLAGSFLTVPIILDGQSVGMIAMRYQDSEACNTPNAWVVLDIFCHTLERAIQLHRNEEILQAKNRELSEKSAQLVQSEKMATIGQMAAGVAHEINNPIGFIMGNLNTLQDSAELIKTAIDVCRQLEPDTPGLSDNLRAAVKTLDKDDLEFMLEDLDELLAESVEGCVRVRDIVQNLKGFARIDEKIPQPVDLNDCIESTLKIVWNELKYKCEIVKQFGELPPLVCFPGQINQVVMNLLINASHAIEEKGTITITTTADADNAVVQITDSGTGMPPEVAAKIFDPFYTTKEPGKGTGLGLYICHNIIEQHGGTIDLDSTVGVGTTFTIRLPLTDVGSEMEDLLV